MRYKVSLAVIRSHDHVTDITRAAATIRGVTTIRVDMETSVAAEEEEEEADTAREVSTSVHSYLT